MKYVKCIKAENIHPYSYSNIILVKFFDGRNMQWYKKNNCIWSFKWLSLRCQHRRCRLISFFLMSRKWKKLSLRLTILLGVATKDKYKNQFVNREEREERINKVISLYENFTVLWDKKFLLMSAFGEGFLCLIWKHKKVKW